MRIGHSVQLAIEGCGLAARHAGERRQVYAEASMLHACNAVDATAKKRYATGNGRVGERFMAFVNDELEVLGAVGMPGVDMYVSEYPYAPVLAARKAAEKAARKNGTQLGPPKIADVLYYVHRCAHGHGDSVADGFELYPSDFGTGNYSTQFSPESVRLPEAMILGLVAMAVLAPENAEGEEAWDAVIPWALGELPVNNWWGRRDDYLAWVQREGYNFHRLDGSPMPPGVDTLEYVHAMMKRMGYTNLGEQ